MKVLIAPDSFKESLEASAFCHVAKTAICDLNPNILVDQTPLADGGEGSVDALLAIDGATRIDIKTTNPLNQTIDAYYAYFAKSKTAILEVASAVGLNLIPVNQRDPALTTSYGSGTMLKDAIKRGAKTIIIGLGGSGTNDAGVGCLAALGFQFLDSSGQSISLHNQGIESLKTIIAPKDIDFSDIDIRVACDITNPLTGEKGASYVFSEQKGANPSDFARLDASLLHFAQVVQRDLALNIDQVAGAGAAGGLGAGLMLIGGRLESGFKIIADFLNLEKKLKNNQYDLIITGEGELNFQSQYGKVPVALAMLAKKYQIPVIAICGGVSISSQEIRDLNLVAAFSICQAPQTLESAMQNAEEQLYHTVQQIISTFCYNDSF